MARSGKSKRSAQRFAVYIQAMGVVPLPFLHRDYQAYAVALQQQYQELRLRLDAKLVTEAKSSARGIIRRKTLAIAAGDLVPMAAPTPRRVSEKPIVPNKVAAKGSFKKKRQGLETFFETMAGVVPKCPRCRMRCGLPKKSWPTREMAYESRERCPDPAEVNVYECPHQVGFWHVGHPRSTHR
jgi:hypothetical protein